MGSVASCFVPAPPRPAVARRLPGPFDQQGQYAPGITSNRLDGLNVDERVNLSDEHVSEADIELPDAKLVEMSPKSTPTPQVWNWKKGPELGNGSFGTVYLGINSDTGGLMAVKQVEQPVVEDERTKTKLMANVRELEREVETLQKLRHPNIVQYYGLERTPKFINIFLEWVPGGSIRDLLNKFGPFDEKMVRSYTKEVLLGLRYLHRMRIMHRDIKGQNVLVDHAGNIKLSDFGASKQIHTMKEGATKDGVDEKNMSLRGTMVFMAPEVMEGTGHGRPADIWSLGCLVVEMLTAKAPWSDRLDKNAHWMTAMYQICKDRQPPSMPDKLSAEGRVFLEMCWQWDPRHRPTCDRLLMHPFIKSAPTPKAMNAARQGMHPAVGMMPSPVQEERQSHEQRSKGDSTPSTPRAQRSGPVVNASPHRKTADVAAITPALGPSGAALTFTGVMASPRGPWDVQHQNGPTRGHVRGAVGGDPRLERKLVAGPVRPTCTAAERPATAETHRAVPTPALAARPFTAGPGAEGCDACSDSRTADAPKTCRNGKQKVDAPAWTQSIASFNPMLSFQQDLLGEACDDKGYGSPLQPGPSIDDDTVVIEDTVQVHRSMLAEKAQSLLKESLEVNGFKQHLENPLYGLQASVSTSHGAFATKMSEAATAGVTGLAPIRESDHSCDDDTVMQSLEKGNSTQGQAVTVDESPRGMKSSGSQGALSSIKVSTHMAAFDLEMERMLSKERQGFRANLSQSDYSKKNLYASCGAHDRDTAVA